MTSTGWGRGPNAYTPGWSTVRRAVIARDGYTCQTCGTTVHRRCSRTGCGQDIHVAHRIAKSDGGPDHPDNCYTSCRDCNIRGPAIRHNQAITPPASITPPQW